MHASFVSDERVVLLASCKDAVIEHLRVFASLILREKMIGLPENELLHLCVAIK